MNSELLKTVTNLGSFAVLVWIIYWVFNKGIPRFGSILDAQRKDYLEESRTAREAFVAEIKSNREHCDRHAIEREKILDHHQEQIDELVKQHHAKLDELFERLRQRS